MKSEKSNTGVDKDYVPCSLNLENVYGANGNVKYQPVRLAIVGAGAMGAEHIQTAYSTGGGEIVGIVDHNPGSIDYAMKFIPESRRKQVKIYASLQEACLDHEVEALIVATPNYTHADVIREALPYRKHILLEKPMAHTEAAAREIYDAIQGYDKVFYVGFEYRDKPLYREVIYEVNHRHSLGEVKMINIMENRRAFLEKWRQWNKFSKYSGGTLVEKCCHYFDLFNVIADSTPVRVFASGAMNVNFRQFEYEGEKSDIIDGAFTIVEYANGVRACLNLCMFLPSGCLEEIRINGARASLYGTDRPESRLKIVSGGDDMDREVIITAQPNVAATGHHDGSTYYEHQRFYRAIRENAKPDVSAADGLWTVAIGAAAEESIRTGMPVAIKNLPPRL